jgi:hypothetical protein
MKKRDPQVERVKFGSEKNRSNSRRRTMSCEQLEVPTDTLRNILMSGLNAMGARIPLNANVLDITFSDLNKKKGMVKLEFKYQKDKEVEVIAQ